MSSLWGEFFTKLHIEPGPGPSKRRHRPGDDVRTIDWNVTARAGAPFVKTFREERQLTVFLLVDVSASGAYGGQQQSKRELAAELAACFAFSAIHNQDQVGLILFSDHVELFLPPRKGAGNTLRLIREILAWEPQGRATSLSSATDLLVESVDRRALCFVLSDFLVPSAEVDEAIRVAGVKHDLVAIQVSDPNEEELPASGRISLEDPETGEQVTIHPSRGHIRARYRELRQHWQEDLEAVLRRRAVDHLHLRTGADYLPEIHGFFQRRARR